MNKLYYIWTNGEDLLAVVVDGKAYCCGEYYMQVDEYYKQHRDELKNWHDDGIREAAAAGYLRWLAEYNNAENLRADWEPYCVPVDAAELDDDGYEIVAEMEIV